MMSHYQTSGGIFSHNLFHSDGESESEWQRFQKGKVTVKVNGKAKGNRFWTRKMLECLSGFNFVG
jgi:hypothetical protein